MSTSRKDFLKLSAAAGALGFGLDPLPAGASQPRGDTNPAERWGSTQVQEAPRKLNILILGGTGFIGFRFGS